MIKKNKLVIYDTLNPPCGTIKVTLRGHTSLIKRLTLWKHGYRVDEERLFKLARGMSNNLCAKAYELMRLQRTVNFERESGE